LSATLDTDTDELLLLAVRECFAEYGATGDESLVSQVALILAIDPDTSTDPTKIRAALEHFKVTHDPMRRDVESMDAAWNLIHGSNASLTWRLISYYGTTAYVGHTPRRKSES